MAKKVFKMVKLQVKGGAANPSPPVGPALGSAGVNIMEFCKQFNGRTQDKPGQVLPVLITVYEDKSFEFVIKTPPAAFLLKKYAKLQSGSNKGANHVVATLTKKEIREIAELKLVDLNAYDVEAAMRIIEGTARNMGIAVKGVNDLELAQQEQEAIQAEKEAARRDAELAKLEEESKVVQEPTETEEESN